MQKYQNLSLSVHFDHKQLDIKLVREEKFVISKCAGKSRLVSILLLIVPESGARFFSQSQTVAMQNQSNCEITFGTQLKTALSELMIRRYMYMYITHGCAEILNFSSRVHFDHKQVEIKLVREEKFVISKPPSVFFFVYYISNYITN